MKLHAYFYFTSLFSGKRKHLPSRYCKLLVMLYIEGYRVWFGLLLQISTSKDTLLVLALYLPWNFASPRTKLSGYVGIWFSLQFSTLWISVILTILCCSTFEEHNDCNYFHSCWCSTSIAAQLQSMSSVVFNDNLKKRSRIKVLLHLIIVHTAPLFLLT